MTRVTYQDILVTRAVFRVISYGRFKVLAAILEAILKIPFDFFFLGFSMSFMMYIHVLPKSERITIAIF